MRWAGPIAALVLLAGGASAEFLQAGYDAARSGDMPDLGPAWGDVAWRIQLDGWTSFTDPLVLDDVALVATQPSDAGGRHALWRIDLETGATELVRDFGDERVNSIASDGERIFVDASSTLYAAPLDDPATELWSVDADRAQFYDTFVGSSPAIVEGAYIVHEVNTNLTPPVFSGRVRSYDAATGELRWTWVRTPEIGTDPARRVGEHAGAPSSRASIAGTAVIGDEVVATGFDLSSVPFGVTEGVPEPTSPVPLPPLPPVNDPWQVAIWGIGLADGALRWHYHGPVNANVTDVNEGLVGGFGDFAGSRATGVPGTVYVKVGEEVLAINPSQPSILWRANIHQADLSRDRGYTALGGDETRVYAAAWEALHGIDKRTGAIAWTNVLAEGANHVWSYSTPLMTRRALIMIADLTVDEVVPACELFGLDPETGVELWRVAHTRSDLQQVSCVFAVSRERALIVAPDGVAILVGRTSASPTASPAATTTYPGIDEEVSVDLSGSAAGADGAATSYRADWGDGETTDWQASPVLTHAYATPGDHEARFHVRNDAGQTASSTLTMRVGQPAPTFLETAFSRENQDIAFFVLGLVVTGVGASYGVWRTQRRRREFRRRMGELESSASRFASDPMRLQEALDGHLAAARGSVLAGKLDEGQFGLVRARAEELRALARMRVVEERFRYLPYGIVQTMQAMLRDGRVNAWERSHLLQLVDADATLHPDQRAAVRALVEEWHDHDARRA